MIEKTTTMQMLVTDVKKTEGLRELSILCFDFAIGRVFSHFYILF